MTAGDADGLARAVIEEAGYGDNFGHSLGHGVGLAVHELPGVGPNSTMVLEDTMAFTVEPGIYITGWGGVRTRGRGCAGERQGQGNQQSPKARQDRSIE